MTDADYDAQTLATSHRLERLHRLRFGPLARTWICPQGHVNRASFNNGCVAAHQHHAGATAAWLRYIGDAATAASGAFPLYGLSDPEELIYSRAN